MDPSDIEGRLSAAFNQALNYFANRGNWTTESFKDNVELYSIQSPIGLKVVVAQMMLTGSPLKILSYIEDLDSRSCWDTFLGESVLIRNEASYKCFRTKSKHIGLTRKRSFVLASQRRMIGDSHVSITCSVELPEIAKPKFWSVRGHVAFQLWMAKEHNDGQTCLTCISLIEPKGIAPIPTTNRLHPKWVQEAMKLLKENIENS